MTSFYDNPAPRSRTQRKKKAATIRAKRERTTFAIISPGAKLTPSAQKRIAGVWDDYPDPKPRISVVSEGPKLPNAHYNPQSDTIRLPSRLASAEQAKVLFHELVHSTGHPSRLNRKYFMLEHFGGVLSTATGPQGERSFASAKEEVCAELGAAMLCKYIGLRISSAGVTQYVRAYTQWMIAHTDRDTARSGLTIARNNALLAVEYICTGERPKRNPARDPVPAIERVLAIVDNTLAREFARARRATKANPPKKKSKAAKTKTSKAKTSVASVVKKVFRSTDNLFKADADFGLPPPSRERYGNRLGKQLGAECVDQSVHVEDAIEYINTARPDLAGYYEAEAREWYEMLAK